MIAKRYENNREAEQYWRIHERLSIFALTYCEHCLKAPACWPIEGAAYEPRAMKRYCRNKHLGSALDRLAELSPLVFPDLFHAEVVEEAVHP